MIAHFSITFYCSVFNLSLNLISEFQRTRQVYTRLTYIGQEIFLVFLIRLFGLAFDSSNHSRKPTSYYAIRVFIYCRIKMLLRRVLRRKATKSDAVPAYRYAIAGTTRHPTNTRTLRKTQPTHIIVEVGYCFAPTECTIIHVTSAVVCCMNTDTSSPSKFTLMIRTLP